MTEDRTLNNLAREQIAGEMLYAAGFTLDIAKMYLANKQPLGFGGHEVTIMMVAPVINNLTGNRIGWCGTALAEDGVTVNWYIDGPEGDGDAFVQPCTFRL